MLPLALHAGCDDGHVATRFSTYQACFDDHQDRLRLDASESIVECCLLHTIGGEREACGPNRATCINYLTANLDDSDGGITRISLACDEYLGRKENMNR